jgi:hypothetical protein
LQAIEDQIIQAHMFPALGVEDADHPVWFALETLLARPWFSRLWVFQESILAKEIIVGCGSEWLNWKILLNLADELCNKYMSWLVQRRTRQKTMETGTRTGFAALLEIDFARRRYDPADGIPVSNLLSQTQGRASKEPIDNLWGILGLMHPDVRDDIRSRGWVDYTAAGKSQFWRSYITFTK